MRTEQENKRKISELLIKYENSKPQQINLEKIEKMIEALEYEDFFELLDEFEKHDQIKQYKIAQEVYLKLQRTPAYSNLLSEDDRDYIREYRQLLVARMKYAEVPSEEIRNLYISLLILESLIPEPIHPNKMVESLIQSLYLSIQYEDFRNSDRLYCEIAGYL